jgi:MinD-like ATPase involved in chromosome partitioning or flagellar assembly
MTGFVTTFYSYKGGVGRSFALANVSVILAQWGLRVLAVDWDIEAPGLSHYFDKYTTSTSEGAVEFLTHCKNEGPLSWETYIQAIEIPDCRGALSLMPAARKGGDYARAVQEMDWDSLYLNHSLVLLSQKAAVEPGMEAVF